MVKFGEVLIVWGSLSMKNGSFCLQLYLNLFFWRGYHIHELHNKVMNACIENFGYSPYWLELKGGGYALTKAKSSIIIHQYRMQRRIL